MQCMLWIGQTGLLAVLLILIAIGVHGYCQQFP